MIPGTHILGDHSQRSSPNYCHSEINDLNVNMVKNFVGAAGKIFFVDAHALHCSLPIQDGEKKILLQLQYSNSLIGVGHTKLPSNCLPTVLPNLPQLLTDFPKVFQAFNMAVICN